MNKQIEILLLEYREAAREHARTSFTNPDIANRAAEKLLAIRKKLTYLGNEALGKFLDLLESDEPEVQCWAAAHALEFAPELASSVLKRLSDEKLGIVSFNAEMTLKEWVAGRLQF